MQVTAPDRGHVTAEVMDALMGIGRRFRRREPGDAVEPGSMWLLRALRGGGTTRGGDLATLLGLDASTVSRHLTQLQRAGLVERAQDPVDGRAQRIQLTAAGQAAVEQAVARRRALLDHSLQSWTDDEVAQLHIMITRMLEGLRDAEEGPDDHGR